MIDYNDIIASIFSRSTGGIRLGLERIRKALHALGDPHTAYRTIHVAGTNGKGSVCAFLESIFRYTGHTTGLFTSPHILRFEERFMINGRPVQSEEWLGVYNDCKDIIDTIELTFFEISTLIAFELFKRKKVDWAIMETGLGGRLDATNVVNPAVSVITPVDYDHMEYLGSDIVDIVKEKLGIAKAATPLLIMPQPHPQTISHISQYCKKNNVPVTFLDGNELRVIDDSPGKTIFEYKNTHFTLAIPGLYQVINALSAIKTYEMIYGMFDDMVVQAVNKTHIPGRFQIIHYGSKSIVCDVAHNPHAAHQFVTALKQIFPDALRCIVAGIMADKAIAPMIQDYCTCADMIICTRPDINRAATAQFLAEQIPGSYKGMVKVIESVKEAVIFADKAEYPVIGITGSFYTVAEAMMALDIDPYASSQRQYS